MATGILSIPLVAGFFSSFHPALDAFAHLRLHLAVLLIVTAIPLLLVRGFRWNGALAAALGTGAILTVTGSSWIPLVGQNFGRVQASHQPDELGPTYRLMQLNLRYNNPEPGKVLSLIGRIRPDVLVFNEVSPMWQEKIALLAGTYPHKLACDAHSHAGGVTILSLRPFTEGMQTRCLGNGILATATIDFGGRFVDLAGIHLRRPWPANQLGQIEDLSPLLGSLGDTAILAGDMNATPWSAASARITRASAMTPAGPDSPTWLSRRLPEWMRFAGFPIDRVFTKGDVVVHSVKTLEWVGSDHLPVLMEFSLKPAEPGDRIGQTATASLSRPGPTMRHIFG